MHYYKRNIGDYAKKAGRLSMLQHGAYTLLIDACYDRERFPTLDEAIEWTWASTPDEIAAVELVLRKFFTLEGDTYVQKRIQEEIEDYREKARTNARIAQDRETKRAENRTNRARSVNESAPEKHESPPNHKPRTINQEPLTSNTVPGGTSAKAPSKPESVSEVIWADFLKVRKAHKAPVTITALEGIVREAEKAGWTLEDAIRECVDRNWRSFKADWVNKPSPTARGAPETFRERDARLAAERMAEFAPGVAARPGKRGFDLEVQDANAIEGYRQIV